ncbi:MAG: GIY-YIG nuclease family protein [Saprospiraceae bacterium]
MSFFTYILYSPRFDIYYVGFTSNLEKRLNEHNEIGVGTFTSKYRPWKLHAFISFETRSQAMLAEKYLKKKPREFLRRVSSESGLVDYIKTKFAIG